MRTLSTLVVIAVAVAAGSADHAAALLAKGEVARAADAARALVKRDGTNVDAWLVLADALVRQGEAAVAWEELERALEAVPGDARLSLKLGDVFVGLAAEEQTTTGDGTTITNFYLDAERMYDEALAKDAKLADALYGKAFANFQLNRKENARKYISACLDADKEHGRAIALQAYMFYLDKKYAEAERLYEIALKLDTSDPLTFVRYGHTLFVQGRKEDAKKAYIQGLVAHPDNPTPIMSGLRYLAGKDWRAATPYLREAAEAAPKSSVTWYYLGYCEFVNGDFEAAAEGFDRAVKLAPKSSSYLYFRGYAREKLGDAKNALADYRKSLEANPEQTESAARFEGIILRMKDDIDGVEKLYEELIELAPGNGWVQNNYGLVLRNWAEARGAAKTGDPSGAVKRRIKRSGDVYEMAAANLTEEPQIQSDCGLLFEFYPCNRDDKKAERYFTRALDISDYTYRDAFDGLNRMCRRAGRWEVLKDYAEGVVGALEDRGRQAVAPVGASAPKELKSETPGMLARAKAAIQAAEAHLPKSEG